MVPRALVRLVCCSCNSWQSLPFLKQIPVMPGCANTCRVIFTVISEYHPGFVLSWQRGKLLADIFMWMENTRWNTLVKGRCTSQRWPGSLRTIQESHSLHNLTANAMVVVAVLPRRRRRQLWFEHYERGEFPQFGQLTDPCFFNIPPTTCTLIAQPFSSFMNWRRGICVNWTIISDI